MKDLIPSTPTQHDLAELRDSFLSLLKKLPLKDRIPFVKSFYKEVSHSEKYEVKDVKESELTIQNHIIPDGGRYHAFVYFGPVPGVGSDKNLFLTETQYKKHLEETNQSINDHCVFFSNRYNVLIEIFGSFPNKNSIKVIINLTDLNELYFNFEGLNDENIATLKVEFAGFRVSDAYLSDSSIYIRKALTLLNNNNSLKVDKLQFVRKQIEDAIKNSLTTESSDIDEANETMAKIDKIFQELQTSDSP